MNLLNYKRDKNVLLFELRKYEILLTGLIQQKIR
jgi:hypothetical protein